MNKLIIFDYDGVIVDSFPKLHEVYKEMCEALKKPCPESLEEFRKTYGENSKECHKNLGFTEEERQFVYDFYKNEITKKSVKMFEGIDKVFKKLSKEFTLIVISTSPATVIKKELERFGVSKYFKEIIGKESSHIKRTRKSEKMKSAIAKYSTPEKTISIGDRKIDFEESTLAGIKNILLVDYGWGYDPTKIPEYKQSIKINSPKEIIKAISLLP